MKRRLQKVFAVIAILAVVIGMTSYFLTHDPDKNKGQQAGIPTVVDASGTTYGVVVNDQGTTYVVVTDVDNNRFMAEYDGVTVGATGAQINSDVQVSDLPTNYTGPNVSASQNASDYAGEVVTSSSEKTSTTQSGDVGHATTNTQSQPTNVQDVTTQQVTTTAADVPTTGSTSQQFKINKYEEIFKSGTYVMTVDMNDPDFPEPVTMALKNGNMYVETAMSMEEGSEPLKLKMIYIKSSDTMYLLIDVLKKYCKLPDEMLEEFDMSSMVSDLKIEGIGDITVSQANINGKDLTVESYVNKSGETVNYYFDGDSIVRIDTVKPSGESSSIYYSYFSTDVPDSYFEVPDNYGYWNLSFLGALL